MGKLSLEMLDSAQRAAIEWGSYRTHANQWLGLGLGKTIVMLCIFRLLRDRFPRIKRMLVVAPKRVGLLTWPMELENWEELNLSYSIAIGSKRKRIEAFASMKDVTILNYDNLVWFLHNVPRSYWPEVIVFDESTHMKGSPGSVRRVREWLKEAGSFQRAFNLTATPASESYADLWSQIACIRPHKNPLGRNITEFRNRYFRDIGMPGGYSKYELRDGADHEILGAISKLTLSLRREDHIELQETRYVDYLLPWPDGTTREAYEEMEEECITTIAGQPIVAVSKGVAFNKLRQMCGGYVFDREKTAIWVHDTKLEWCQELVESLNGSPVLIFYQYTPEAARLREVFPDAEHFRAGLSADRERDILDRWNRRKIPQLILHPDSAGEGLNLQAPCHHAIWFSLPWSRGRYDQANGRIDRRGQTEQCIIYRLLMEDSMDQQVLQKLGSKGETQQEIFALIARMREAINVRRG
jgi:SNF2 family DNA or RNA helicase